MNALLRTDDVHAKRSTQGFTASQPYLSLSDSLWHSLPKGAASLPTAYRATSFLCACCETGLPLPSNFLDRRLQHVVIALFLRALNACPVAMTPSGRVYDAAPGGSGKGKLRSTPGQHSSVPLFPDGLASVSAH
jgi:hypothetical protein